MKRIFTLLLVAGVFLSAHGQQWVKQTSDLYYYNADGPIYLAPDYSSYVVYFKEGAPSDVNVNAINTRTLKETQLFENLDMAQFDADGTFDALDTREEINNFLRTNGLEAKGAYTMAPAFRANGQRMWLTKEVIVSSLVDPSDARLQNIVRQYDAKLVRSESTLIYSVEQIEKQFEFIQALKRAGLIDWAQPDFKVEIERHNDPLFSEQYQMHNTGGSLDGLPLLADIDVDALEAWGISTGSSSITVAVIDDGLESHPDLPTISAGFTPANGANGTPNASGEHGVACAGIIAGQHNNSIGVRGVAPGVNLISVNIFQGGETVQDLADAFTWAKNQGADVMSNSWGFSGNCSPNLYQAITDAIDDAADNGRGGLGSVILFSTGNDFNSCVSYPGNLASVVGVGALRPDGNISSYSNQGSNVDVVAPSNDYNSTQTGFIYGVRTTDRTGSSGYSSGDYTTTFGGTSAACPAAAGVAALVLSVNPSLTQSQVFDILTNTADDMGSSGRDNTYGYGRVNAHQAVLSAGGVVDTDPPSTPTNLSVSNVTATTADASWSASTDNIGVSSYTLYLNGSNVGTSTGTSATLTGLSPSTSYSLTVSASDAASNESGQSSAAGFTTTVATLSCASTVSSYPYSEGFESGDGWTQDGGDDGDWVNFSGSTPSTGTGPSSAGEGSSYMYLEASTNGTAGQIGNNGTASLTSDCFDLSGATSATFSFQYHMYGANMGSLSLQASQDDVSWNTIWTLSGNQGNAWSSANVDLAAYLGGDVKLRLEGTTGPGWESDVAIDDLSLTTGGGGGDTQAPSTPSGLSASNITTSSFDVSWNASSDNVGVTGYNVYLDGSLDGSTASTSYSFSGLASSTTYAVAVEAYDAASNVSGQGSANVTTDTPTGGCTEQTVNNSNGFESGWGIWNDGGSDARRSANDAAYSNGTYSIRLRDNTSTSVMTTDNLDLSLFEEITVSFSYYARSMDNANEDFWLQISTSGSFSTVEEWNQGDEFQNNNRYNDAVTIQGPFSSTTQVRFRCDASGNSDWVYIDDIVIEGCSNGTSMVITSNNLSLPEEEIEEFDLEEVEVYPNPTVNVVNIRNMPVDGSIKVMNISGQVIFEGVTNQVDLSNQPTGLYLLQISSDGEDRVIKIKKQ